MTTLLNTPWLTVIQQLRLQFPLLVPLVLLCLATLVFCWIPLDLWIAQWFYEREKVFWAGYGREPWRSIDRLCVYPGMIVGVAAVLYSVGAFLFLIPAARCRGVLLVACIFLTGPGLLVNCTLKPAFSRPRPRDVVSEPNALRYLPPLTPSRQFYWNSSFPSGHAAIGYFALLAPAFAMRNRVIWRRSLLAAGLIYGSLMGYSRMIQGGHFLSDIVWSLAIIYLTGWAMTVVIEHKNLIPVDSGLGNRNPQPESPNPTLLSLK